MASAVTEVRGRYPAARTPGGGHQVTGHHRTVAVPAARLPCGTREIVGGKSGRQLSERSRIHYLGLCTPLALHGHVGPQLILLAGLHDPHEAGPAHAGRGTRELCPRVEHLVAAHGQVHLGRERVVHPD
jgi:hypothetical protein